MVVEKYDNVSLLVDKQQGEIKIIMKDKQPGFVDNEYLCTLELNTEEEK